MTALAVAFQFVLKVIVVMCLLFYNLQLFNAYFFCFSQRTADGFAEARRGKYPLGINHPLVCLKILFPNDWGLQHGSLAFFQVLVYDV